MSQTEAEAHLERRAAMGWKPPKATKGDVLVFFGERARETKGTKEVANTYKNAARQLNQGQQEKAQILMYAMKLYRLAEVKNSLTSREQASHFGNPTYDELLSGMSDAIDSRNKPTESTSQAVAAAYEARRLELIVNERGLIDFQLQNNLKELARMSRLQRVVGQPPTPPLGSSND